jgi:hypothetical protein
MRLTFHTGGHLMFVSNEHSSPGYRSRSVRVVFNVRADSMAASAQAILPTGSNKMPACYFNTLRQSASRQFDGWGNRAKRDSLIPVFAVKTNRPAAL